MHIAEITGRAEHIGGGRRIIRTREGSDEYQMLKKFGQDDDPVWCTVSKTDWAPWPEEGWIEIEDRQ